MFPRKDTLNRHMDEQHSGRKRVLKCHVCGSNVYERCIDEHFRSQACRQAQSHADGALIKRMYTGNLVDSARRPGPLLVGDMVSAVMWALLFAPWGNRRTPQEHLALEYRGLALRLMNEAWSDQTKLHGLSRVATLIYLEAMDGWQGNKQEERKYRSIGDHVWKTHPYFEKLEYSELDSWIKLMESHCCSILREARETDRFGGWRLE